MQLFLHVWQVNPVNNNTLSWIPSSWSIPEDEDESSSISWNFPLVCTATAQQHHHQDPPEDDGTNRFVDNSNVPQLVRAWEIFPSHRSSSTWTFVFNFFLFFCICTSPWRGLRFLRFYFWRDQCQCHSNEGRASVVSYPILVRLGSNNERMRWEKWRQSLFKIPSQVLFGCKKMVQNDWLSDVYFL